MQKTCEGREAFGLAQLPCPCRDGDQNAVDLVALLQHDPGLDQGTVQLLPPDFSTLGMWVLGRGMEVCWGTEPGAEPQ